MYSAYCMKEAIALLKGVKAPGLRGIRYLDYKGESWFRSRDQFIRDIKQLSHCCVCGGLEKGVLSKLDVDSQGLPCGHEFHKHPSYDPIAYMIIGEDGKAQFHQWIPDGHKLRKCKIIPLYDHPKEGGADE